MYFICLSQNIIIFFTTLVTIININPVPGTSSAVSPTSPSMSSHKIQYYHAAVASGGSSNPGAPHPMYQHPMTKYAIDAAAASAADPTGSLTYNHFYAPSNPPNPPSNNPSIPAAAFMNAAAHNSPTTAAASAVFIKHE